MATRVGNSNSGASNNSLHSAKREKNDEFYTQLSDIERELLHYKEHLKSKVVLCNCDDPEWSSFWKYFTLNFEHLGLAKVIATHYANGEPSYKLEYSGSGNPVVKTPLAGDGDFRSSECIEILKEADLVVTNPPFSLFREYVAQLIEHEKQFLIIGNNNAITYKETFRLIKENQMWIGVSPRSMKFRLADGTLKDVNACWFTNLEHKKRNEELILFRSFGEKGDLYLKYENFDAIEVSKVVDIPLDFKGLMGVPITFLDKYNPAQFEVIGLGIATSGLEVGVKPYTLEHKTYRKTIQKRGAVDGDLYLIKDGELVVPYARIIIKRKNK